MLKGDTGKNDRADVQKSVSWCFEPVNHTGPEEQRSQMTECKVLSTNHQCAGGDLTVDNYEDNDAVFQKRSERKQYKELLIVILITTETTKRYLG